MVCNWLEPPAAVREKGKVNTAYVIKALQNLGIGEEMNSPGYSAWKRTNMRAMATILGSLKSCYEEREQNHLAYLALRNGSRASLWNTLDTRIT